MFTAIDYKVDWERELERHKRLGIKAPAPIPHPDDIVTDMKTGTVRLKGPLTKMVTSGGGTTTSWMAVGAPLSTKA